MTFDEAKEFLEKHEDSFLTDDNCWLEGMAIFKKYNPKFGTAYDLHAEHDVIYVTAFDEDMTEEDILALYRKGFHLDDDNEGWAMFT
jgi:hypothetical protein